MMTNTFHEIFSSFRQWLKMLFWWEIEIVSIFDHENKGLEIDNNKKWNENNTQQHCLFHDQAMCSECRLSNLIIRMIGKHINNILIILIIFSSIQMACPSIRNFYSSIRMAKQTVQIIYSPVWMVCPSVRNFYLSVQMADQTVQIIHLFERLGKLFKHFKDCLLTTRHPCVFAIWTVFH